jgi:hypothetical protein
MIVGAVASGVSVSSTGDGSRYGTQPGYDVASGADGQQTGLNNSANGCQLNF